ncbi:MAG: hypothetical protein FJ146_11690 [Deltaproteobacteria bacterium]|nr:hypothetical protein [Deltaproteobacteria bacterium]
MIIFQTVGCGCAGGLKISAGVLDGGDSSATTFRTNEYIHRLNRALQAEMRAYATYTGSLAHPHDNHDWDQHADHHQQASRDLVRLIIGNRGIPEDRTALSLGLTEKLVKLCTMVPTKLTDKVSASTLRRMELGLVLRYRKLIKMAPARDRPDLQRLLKSTMQIAAR